MYIALFLFYNTCYGEVARFSKLKVSINQGEWGNPSNNLYYDTCNEEVARF